MHMIVYCVMFVSDIKKKMHCIQLVRSKGRKFLDVIIVSTDVRL